MKDGKSCHSTCKEYIDWKGEVSNVSQYLRNEAERTADADALFIQKCLRYQKAINRLPKKKG